MPRKKKTSRLRYSALLSREVAVASVSASTSIRAERERSVDEPDMISNASIELTGTMDEPVRDNRDVVITIYPTDSPTAGKDPIPWVGLVHGVKPTLRPAVFISNQDFERVWGLAVSGLLKHAHMSLTPPRYKRAFVTRISFSTHLEE